MPTPINPAEYNREIASIQLLNAFLTNYDGGDHHHRGVQAVTDNTFVEWLSHQQLLVTEYNPLSGDAGYDSDDGKSRV